MRHFVFWVQSTGFWRLHLALCPRPEERIDAGLLEVFRTGVDYQALHALALLAVGLIGGRAGHDRALQLAGWSFASGILLFSGSLYVMALTDIRWLERNHPVRRDGLSHRLGCARLVRPPCRIVIDPGALYNRVLRPSATSASGPDAGISSIPPVRPGHSRVSTGDRPLCRLAARPGVRKARTSARRGSMPSAADCRRCWESCCRRW